MEDANGLILWVVGYRINDKVKILDTTKVIFQCDLEHYIFFLKYFVVRDLIYTSYLV